MRRSSVVVLTILSLCMIGRAAPGDTLDAESIRDQIADPCAEPPAWFPVVQEMRDWGVYPIGLATQLAIRSDAKCDDETRRARAHQCDDKGVAYYITEQRLGVLVDWVEDEQRDDSVDAPPEECIAPLVDSYFYRVADPDCGPVDIVLDLINGRLQWTTGEPDPCHDLTSPEDYTINCLLCQDGAMGGVPVRVGMTDTGPGSSESVDDETPQ